VIETIQEIGPDQIPDAILQKWNLTILEVIEFGGVEFEF
jgi:hypothetical protein